MVGGGGGVECSRGVVILRKERKGWKQEGGMVGWKGEGCDGKGMVG
jgi:hypothetical protein